MIQKNTLSLGRMFGALTFVLLGLSSMAFAAEYLVVLGEGQMPGRKISYLGYHMRPIDPLKNGVCIKSDSTYQPFQWDKTFTKKTYYCRVEFILKYKLEITDENGTQFVINESAADPSRDYVLYYPSKDYGTLKMISIKEGEKAITPEIENEVKNFYFEFAEKMLNRLSSIHEGTRTDYNKRCIQKRLALVVSDDSSQAIKQVIKGQENYFDCPENLP